MIISTVIFMRFDIFVKFIPNIFAYYLGVNTTMFFPRMHEFIGL